MANDVNYGGWFLVCLAEEVAKFSS